MRAHPFRRRPWPPSRSSQSVRFLIIRHSLLISISSHQLERRRFDGRHRCCCRRRGAIFLCIVHDRATHAAQFVGAVMTMVSVIRFPYVADDARWVSASRYVGLAGHFTTAYRGTQHMARFVAPLPSRPAVLTRLRRSLVRTGRHRARGSTCVEAEHAADIVCGHEEVRVFSHASSYTHSQACSLLRRLSIMAIETGATTSALLLLIVILLLFPQYNTGSCPPLFATYELTQLGTQLRSPGRSASGVHTRTHCSSTCSSASAP
jgi:hypothetical protein